MSDHESMRTEIDTQRMKINSLEAELESLVAIVQKLQIRVNNHILDYTLHIGI